jgi:hypothetical protein
MSALYQMMGHCFNEDWYLDYASPKAAVDGYLERFPTEDIQQALAELRELLARNMTEDELDYHLTHVLHCAYNMAADGLTPSGWLAMVAEQIENGLKEKLSV